jgi:hypothetical protein
MTKVRAGLIAVTAIALGFGLAGCGSDTKSESAAEESTSATSSEAAPTTSAQASGPSYTIVDYIRDNAIVEKAVKRGEPGSPTIELPIPPGWADAGDRTPNFAYAAIVFTDPAVAANPPTIVALLSKLTGNVEPAKILEFAPGEIKNLPGYEGPGEGNPVKLSGFDATQVGGAYTKDGKKRVIAQKTVVIPGQDGLYVMQFNADGAEDQLGVLMEATAFIDQNTKITP